MKKLFYFFSLFIFLISCNKEIENNDLKETDPYKMSGILETSSKEIMRNAILELNQLLVTNTEKNVQKEIFYASQNGKYADNYVKLNDFLDFEKSSVYKSAKVPYEVQGSLKNLLFNQVKSDNKYPNLYYLIHNKKNKGGGDFYSNADISLYVPYVIDDNNRPFNPESKITYVPCVIDADKAKGYKNGDSANSIEMVMADDDYSGSNLTYLIQPIDVDPEEPGYGGDGGYNPPATPTTVYTGNEINLLPGGTQIREVKFGHIKLKEQYDHYVSFTGNGGGSEIRLCRKGSMEHLLIDSTGNVDNSQWDVIASVDVSRYDIRKKNWIWVASNYDTNWEGNNSQIYEQAFSVWEEDNEGDITASASLKWKDEDLLSFNYSITNQSKDSFIHHDQWDVNWFFATVFLDHGCGFKNGEGAFNRAWPIRSCGTNLEYTMVYRWLEVGNNNGY